MRVAYVSHHKRPNYEYTWFAAMPAEKVVFITTETPDDTNRQPNVEHRVVGYAEKGWENKFFASVALRVFYKDFEEALKDIDVVVVLEVFSSLSKQFVAYCKSINKPVVVLVYELIDTHPIYKVPRYRGNTKYVINNADRFVAVSYAAAKHLEILGAGKDKISVVYPGIDLGVFKADSTGRKPHGIAFVGKLGPHKGVDTTLAVYEKLVADIPDLTLLMAGDGAQRGMVEAFAAKYPGVTYVGNVPNAQLPAQVLNPNSVYILPARHTKKLGQRIGAEQFGFSIVEAMACGLAIATTDCGALPEIVTTKNIVCQPGDAESLYLELRALFADEKRLSELQSYNRQLASERYNLTTEAAAFAAILQQVCSERK